MLAPLAAKLLYSHEQPLPSNNKREEEREEPISEPTQDIDKDFEAFYRADPKDSLALAHCHLVAAQVSKSQEATNVPEAMVLEEKTLDLLALLTAHAGGDTLMVPIVPRPPTPAPPHTPTTNAHEKKRKGGK